MFDTEDKAKWWRDYYGAEYPVISGEAGGEEICDSYIASTIPTVILISPDTVLLENDIAPLSGADLIEKLEKYDINKTTLIEDNYEKALSRTNTNISYMNSGTIVFKKFDAGNYEFKMYSINGKIIFNQKLSLESVVNYYNIDKEIPKGFYLLELKCKSFKYRKRLLIE